MSLYPAENQRRKVTLACDPDSNMTEQCHAEECDIRNILRKYKTTGVINHVNKHQGTYGDFTGSAGLKEALDQVGEAYDMFESVPSHIREKFANDAGKFIDFMNDENNAEEIRALGLSDSHLVNGIDPEQKYFPGQRYYPDPDVYPTHVNNPPPEVPEAPEAPESPPEGE